MLKDLMKAILNEDVEVEEDEIEEEQEKKIEPQTVSQPEPQSQPMPKETYVEPISAYPEPEIETFTRPKVQPKKEPKTSIFTGLDVEEVSRVEPRSTNKPYKYDRRKMMKLRTSEDLDYKPIISPIFGDIQEENKQFEKVHDAIKLQKPQDDTSFVEIISPMYGKDIPEPQPVESIPTVKPVFKKNEEKNEPESTLSLSDMLEKPKKQKTKQENLFDLKD